MKVDIITRELIKPSSPTPNHQKSFKLSLLDQLSPPIYTPLVLFYDTGSSGGRGVSGVSVTEISRRLKASLAETLTHFYPFAGRIKDHIWVDCNDEGVEYLEARVDSPLSDILEHPKMETLKNFIPNAPWGLGPGPLFLIQASFYECGGLALGICTSHKIADAATFTTFVTSWAAISGLGYPPEKAGTPDFSAANLFPPKDPFPEIPFNIDQIRKNGVSRRCVFEASKIVALQAKSTSASITRPTRVEVVATLLWQTAMSASRSRLGSARSSALILPVNLRSRLVPPLPENSFGNLVRGIITQVKEGEKDLSTLICHLRTGISELRDKFGKKLQGEEGSLLILDCTIKLRDLLKNKEAMDIYTISSWCRFPFYEADFGWGKPTWMTIGDLFQLPNIITLTDAKDGNGIEAWVTLTEEDMALFACDHELLRFCSLDPSALN